jgi:hypothetical protein
MLKNIGTKIGKQLASWNTFSVGMPIMFAIGAVSLVLYVQPAPAQINSQRASYKKSVTHHASVTSKVTQPVVTAAPQATTASPSSSPATTVKTPTQVGTSKTEPVVTPSPSSSVSGLTPTTPAAAATSSQTPSSQTTTGYTSTNWSGYLAANGSFTAISGSWAATLATGSGSTISADSTWIGIGGVTTSDLIQVGTQNTVAADGQVTTSAFYELLPSVSQPVPGVTVSPGDIMTASLSEVSNGQWLISITDKTDGESDTMTVSYASSLSSAEWIEEDPSFSFRRQIPFDNFHEAFFTGGSTITNGSTVSIVASNAQPVTMVSSSGQTVAVPSVIGSDSASFSVTP